MSLLLRGACLFLVLCVIFFYAALRAGSNADAKSDRMGMEDDYDDAAC